MVLGGKRKLFADLYISNNNPIESVLKAGYETTNPAKKSKRLLEEDSIKRYIEIEQAKKKGDTRILSRVKYEKEFFKYVLDFYSKIDTYIRSFEIDAELFALMGNEQGEKVANLFLERVKGVKSDINNFYESRTKYERKVFNSLLNKESWYTFIRNNKSGKEKYYNAIELLSNHFIESIPDMQNMKRILKIN